MRIVSRLSIAALLTFFYVLTGTGGLALSSLNPYVSPVWAPTGVAIAALLVLGYRWWPTILAGAFIVNIVASGAVLSAVVIAIGSTIEAVLAVYLVHRFANGVRVFDHVRDVYRFAGIAGLLAPTVGATIGVGGLWLDGRMSSANAVDAWMTWLFGGAAGALIVAPLLILWAKQLPRYARRQLREGLWLLASVLLFCALVLRAPASIQHYPLGFVALPLIVWAAFRFGPREAVTTSVLLAAFTLWRTSQGIGLFAGYNQHDSLVLMQLFMAFISLTALALAAVVVERRRAEESRRWLATIVESSNDAIIGKNLDGIILSWNRAAEGIYGYTAEEAIGNPISFLVPPERFDEVSQMLARIRRDERVEHYETKHARKDRSRVDVLLTVSPIKDEAGHIIGASTIARDLSDRMAFVAPISRSPVAADN